MDAQTVRLPTCMGRSLTLEIYGWMDFLLFWSSDYVVYDANETVFVCSIGILGYNGPTHREIGPGCAGSGTHGPISLGALPLIRQ